MNSDKSTHQLLNILRSFNAITERITECKENQEQLIQAILDLPMSMPNVSYASILLLDEKQSRFESTAVWGKSPFNSDLKEILDVSKLLKCNKFTNDKKMSFSELVDESKMLSMKPEHQQCLAKMIYSPLVTEQKVIGLACVYGQAYGRDILEAEEFSLWVKLASLAIEKSSLYNQIHKSFKLTGEELKRRESECIRSEKLRSLAEITLSVAHAIRNPVTVIGGLSSRLNRALPGNDPKRRWSEIILSETFRLESIVQEFERFFSINQISFHRMDVNQLVEEAVDDFLSQCEPDLNLTLKKRLCNEPLFCSVDPGLIVRCFIHLLVNAKEASKDSIHITLATSRKGKDAIIDVTDSGKGMSREEMDHVFDPFYSTKGYGAGIGLTFVHFVISEHSGQVELRSEKGVGTQFKIHLPLEISR
jgi:signal transduction histidine kinase